MNDDVLILQEKAAVKIQQSYRGYRARTRPGVVVSSSRKCCHTSYRYNISLHISYLRDIRNVELELEVDPI